MRCGDFGGETAKGNPCSRRAGWGTDASTGRCRYHVGPIRQRAGEDAEIPPPPGHLSDEAKQAWTAILAEYVLGPEELLNLSGTLESWDLYRSARVTVQRDGAVVEAASGALKRHPAVLVCRDALRDYRAGIRELGVSTNLEV